MPDSITILGEEIRQEDMPVLYRWARMNPRGLEARIKRMMEKDGSTVAVCLLALESNLQNIDLDKIDPPTVCKFDKPIDEERRKMLSGLFS